MIAALPPTILQAMPLRRADVHELSPGADGLEGNVALLPLSPTAKGIRSPSTAFASASVEDTSITSSWCSAGCGCGCWGKEGRGGSRQADVGEVRLLPPNKYGTLQGTCEDQSGALPDATQEFIFFSGLMTKSCSTRKSHNVSTNSGGGHRRPQQTRRVPSWVIRSVKNW